ncbi:MAG: diaminopimelate decarboxylase, partial [Chloroflexota bacterium]
AIRRETGAEVEEMNIGGGLGIRYLPEHHPPSFAEFAEAVTSVLWDSLRETGLDHNPPTLAQEPGRSLVGEAGTTLYRVGGIKEIP